MLIVIMIIIIFRNTALIVMFQDYNHNYHYKYSNDNENGDKKHYHSSCWTQFSMMTEIIAIILENYSNCYCFYDYYN